MKEKDSAVNKNKVKAKQMVAVLVDLKKKYDKLWQLYWLHNHSLTVNHSYDDNNQVQAQDLHQYGMLKENALEGNTGQKCIKDKKKASHLRSYLLCLCRHWRNECPNQCPQQMRAQRLIPGPQQRIPDYGNGRAPIYFKVDSIIIHTTL